ncbi:MAG: ABC transporter [Deltaproteobacteria bacterium]|nr:MAG: ABC transporter [Deltaproteobacteria bacterium]
MKETGTGEPLVEIEDLCYSIGGRDILHDIHLTIKRGDFISIIGPNGGGKTTLLKLILGLLEPTRGRIGFPGEQSMEKTVSIGYVPQYVNHNLNFPATAIDVVLMGKRRPKRRFRLGFSAKERALAGTTLDKLGVGACAKQKIATLSGGQRQRVLIARALISDPNLLILDEPTASIDTKGQAELYELLVNINREQTILLVSHDLLMLSNYTKSIVCLNRRLLHHKHITSSNEVLQAFYSCSEETLCPVDLIAKK